MNVRLLGEISEILNTIERYWINGKLAKQLVIEDLRNNDSNLISKLLSNQIINETYVQNIDGYKVFDKEAFISMLRYKNYWQDSYTKYANKIGLTSDGKYLNYNSDIVLDFPFKDCVLEGGMTKEDSILKNNERFYNQVIAKDEIDSLFSSKAFTKIQKYDENGTHNIKDIKDNDNLILKGNNLVSLYSLKKRYEGKIDLIYIDPPYNTGSDSFLYNDRFNHSTWLTFMKNRLEIAKELLAETGSIFIQLDDNEDSYIKILLDEVFGKENFRNKITWKRRGGSANPSNRLNNVVEYILWYSKSNLKFKYKPVFTKNDENTKKYIKERFVHKDKDNRVYMKSPIQSPNYRENLIYDYKGYKTPKKGYSVSKHILKKWDEEGKLDFPDSKDKNINRKIYLDEYKGQPISSLWTDIYVINPMSNERQEFSGGQKPEALIKRIIEMVTTENDIILDFFMGSATTQAAAHKMNRQYIGIEQMDYINTVSVPRLRKVIEGEQSGVSKDVDWQGGGSFVYAELAKENQEIVDKIISSNTKEELSQQINNLLDNGVLNYEVDFNEFTNTKKEFNELKLEEQKEVLIRVLDSNQLYVNYSDIEDTAYNFTEDEIAFNHSFYGGE
ncbi:cytosine methyltransferase [Staphylococcus sp. HMSC065C10]|uniref:DNA methyltransferase n=1 Tax=Staphylococcus sp. HMSC065C10 TaxID=1739325 RepID=UPI0008A5003E|nr:site-specific DNA-methyltransferase [Staphylococcus sp. HMSC065C10]OFK31658.1 cytosine methyltransferase [Staphylococcus sp. HMSC065C10]